jgi:hypothetical protein
MRTQLWNNLANVKFKALYTCECSRLAGKYARVASFILAVIAASSVATWAIWKEHTTTWAVIIGTSQLLQIALPYIPFIKNEKEFIEMSFEFEHLYLEYEKLWVAHEQKQIKDKTLSQRFYELRQKEIAIEKGHKEARCPDVKRWKNMVNKEMEDFLSLNFS